MLLDYQLPDIVGIDLLPRLRAAIPHLSVIMLTGLDDVDTSVAALKAGADDFQTKGKLTTDSLLRSIANVLDNTASPPS